MRTRWFWLVVLTVGVLGVGAGRAQDVTNILPNGGFESGAIGPFGTYGAATTEIVTECVGAAVPEPPVEGTHCLHVTVAAAGTNNWDVGMTDGSLSFKQGKKYTFSVFMKTKSGTLQVRLKPEHSTGDYAAYGELIVTVTDTWTEFTTTTPVMAADVTPASPTFHFAFAPGDFWIDGVRFYEGDYVAPSFRKIPTAQNPSPKTNAVDVPRDATLSWKAGPFVGTHNVYFGTASDDVNNATLSSPASLLVSRGQADAAYTPASILDFGQTYYWRVDEVNASADATVYKGDLWSFTTETYGYPIRPIKATASSVFASTMGPDKTIDGSGLDALDQHGVAASQMWLSKKNISPVWIQYEFDKAYKLYQMWVWNSNQAVEPISGFGAKEVKVETSTDGTTWTALAGVPEFADATGEPNYVHNTTVDFGGVEAKYVKLTIATNWADGTKQAGLAEVRFFYLPVKAFSPTPADAATGVARNAVLNWRPGRLAAKHQVYLGTDASALPLVGTVTPHSLNLDSLGLLYGKTYYWRVDEANDAASPAVWQGDLWSFTTIGYAVVDDFEAYDDACSRIFFSWKDGFGYSASPDCGVAGSAGNQTGSTVGNINPPFAEKTIIHGGNKSMPMPYDNTKAPFYSEAEREFATPQVWTTGGLSTLQIFVRGDAPSFLEISPGTILMNGTGTDVWDASDQFRFVYKTLKGNGSIVAKVESVGNTHEWAKAGVMIRETASSGSTHAFTAATPNAAHGVSFQRRLDTDMATNASTDVANMPMPQWVKVTRNGSTFTSQYSADGKTWTDVLAGGVTINMANDVMIGLAVTSHAAGAVCGATFSNVSTTGTVSASWQVVDIGAAQTGGNSPESFYVAVQDSAGKVKAVTNPDTTVIATGSWQQWNIPLSQFSSAGVNVGSIKKIMVGVGDRTSPKAGGAGKVYIDDILLVP